MKSKPFAFSPEEVLAVASYDPETGLFTNLSKGKVLGSVSTHNGYVHVGVLGRSVLAHRLAWFVTFGECPDRIDHINGDRQDNRLVNLRPTTMSENIINTKKFHSSSGIKGVYRHDNTKRWQAKIGVNGRCLHLGYFDSKAEAGEARRLAEEKFYPTHAPSLRATPPPSKAPRLQKRVFKRPDHVVAADRANRAQNAAIRRSLKGEFSSQALKDAIHYAPDTGIFTWRIPCANQRKGTLAGYTAPDGRKYISVGTNRVFAHRLAWLYMTGRWPDGPIDHINRDPSDNRWCNLREATHSQNTTNRATKNASGYKGVRKHWTGRYEAYISVDGKQKYLGGFDNPEDAHLAYRAAAHRYFGEFACTETIPGKTAWQRACEDG